MRDTLDPTMAFPTGWGATNTATGHWGCAFLNNLVRKCANNIWEECLGKGTQITLDASNTLLQRYNLHRQRYRNKQPLKSKSLVPGTDNKSSGRQSDRVIRQNIVTSGNWLQSSLATWRRWPGFPPGWASRWVLLVLVFAPAVPLPCMGHSAQAPPNS